MKNHRLFTHSIDPASNPPARSPWRRGFVIAGLALATFGFSLSAQAVCRDGCDGDNTFQGEDALIKNTGLQNTAIGSNALGNNTGHNNTGMGANALGENALGNNSAVGCNALGSNTGGANTAIGAFALEDNDGDENTAVGYLALVANTTGSCNTATGVATLDNNTTGSTNTADGYNALLSNTTGGNNTATGASALFRNTVAGNNTAVGANALFNNTGANNIAIGASAGINLTTGNYNIDIGSKGAARENRRIRIGTQGTQFDTYIAGISGVVVPTGVTVLIESTGKLGTTTSSARYKEAIQPMDKASEAIHALQPVTFRYKHELDPNGIPQFGLVAEEVEKVNPDLVARDADGKAFTVRYDAVNAMLLNEFLKEHRKGEQQDRKIAEQEAMIAQLQLADAEQRKEITALTAALKEQAAQIQKVSRELALSRPAPRVVVSAR